MGEIDFITAFARLLRDGKLRDLFANNPLAAANQIHLATSELPAWRQLNPDELEFQAEVLLRKRLDLVKFFAPKTCAQVEERLWPTFREFARENWPPENTAKFLDAFQFCGWLKQRKPEVIAAAEWNRLDFAVSNHRMNFHFVRLPDARWKMRHGLQIFLRRRAGRWHEFFLYPGW
ncbi:MAG TPA: hypothetical protein VK742_14760 [Candidatus Sulfotelmatobacter sp.]|nr:hypothetical protein [Candidatus Sulfotelmatobacter sp.]